MRIHDLWSLASLYRGEESCFRRPAEFSAKEEAPQSSLQSNEVPYETSEESDTDDDLAELQPNVNRPRIVYEVSEDED